MARLIDADHIRQFFEYGLFDEKIKDAILRILDTEPTVDAAPVVHGRWYQKQMTVPKGRGQTYLVWACSVCNKHEKKRSSFCPHCGAKMDWETVL
jgi:rubrerythrin